MTVVMYRKLAELSHTDRSVELVCYGLVTDWRTTVCNLS